MKIRIVKYVVYFLTFILSIPAKGVDSPPYFLRACLDRTTSILTVSYLPVSDPCNSFVKYVLYGRESVVQPYINLGQSTSMTAGSFTVLMPNKKKWELFITVYFACNGSDTFNSNTLWIDDIPPGLHEPDSVSVDLATQQLVAGWTDAPEPDVMGYSMFKVDPANGNNILIQTKNQTKDTFNSVTFNTSNPGNRFALAVFDSCRNEGIISNYHSPILLTYLNADACKKQVTIGWSSYIGWATEESYVYVRDDVSNIWQLVATIAEVPGPNTYTYDLPFFNRTYTFYIRSKKLGSGISSSSNSISYLFVGPQMPTFNNIGHVSTLSNTSIEITGAYDKTADVSKAYLQRSLNGFTWNTVFTNTTGSFTYTDASVSANTTLYYYRIVLENTCTKPFDSSSIHNSILLERNAYVFTWNNYNSWPSSPVPGDLEFRPIQTSLWKSIGSAGTSYVVIDTADGYCYRVKAWNVVNGNAVDQAVSNILCLKAADSTLIPNTFNPDGKNTVFKIVNPNLIPGQALMYIYNRWGAKIFEGDALSGWNGRDKNDIIYSNGVYIYRVVVTRQEKREQFNGTIYLVR